MIEFIALNVQIILVAALIVIVLGIACVITGLFQDSDKLINTGAAVVIMSLIFAVTIVCNTSYQYPVSNAAWKTIYKNDLNANAKITYDDFSDEHSLNTDRKHQSVKELQSLMSETDHVTKLKLTVTKDEDSITKRVMLEKDNLIAKGLDPNNVYIEKIEYRPIEGVAPKVFGIKSRTSESKEEGEIRITFKSKNDKSLEELFKN